MINFFKLQPLLEKNTMELKNSDEVRERSLIALDQAIHIIGNYNRLGKALGINGTLIAQWKRSGKYGVNAKYVLPIEKLTNNQVTRYELRCDLYPEQDTYFIMITKFVRKICLEYNLVTADDLGKQLDMARNVIGQFISENAASAKKINNIMKYTNHPNQFKTHLFDDNYTGCLEGTDFLEQQAYFAFRADLCVAFYEYLNKNETQSQEQK